MPLFSTSFSPEGPSTQIGRILGPKVHTLNGFLNLETLLFGYSDPEGLDTGLAATSQG